MIKSSFAVLFKINNLIHQSIWLSNHTGSRVRLHYQEIISPWRLWRFGNTARLCVLHVPLWLVNPLEHQALEHNELLKQADKDLLWTYESASAQAIMQDTGDSFRSAVSEFITTEWREQARLSHSLESSLIDSSLLVLPITGMFSILSFITDVLKVHANSPFNMHCMRHSIKQSDRIGKSLKYCGQIMPCKFRLNLRSARSHSEHPSNALATRLSSSWENETFLLKYHNLMMSVSENVENKFLYSRF